MTEKIKMGMVGGGPGAFIGEAVVASSRATEKWYKIKDN